MSNRLHAERRKRAGHRALCPQPRRRTGECSGDERRLGGKTAFIGKVGRDGFGDFLRQTLLDSGIDVSGLAVDEKVPTTLAFVQLDANGDRSFTFYRSPGADIMLRESEVDTALLDDCAIFHFGSVSMTADPCRTATLSAAAMRGRRENSSASTRTTVRFSGTIPKRRFSG